MQTEVSEQIFSRNQHKSNFMKIRPVGTELFHRTDGQIWRS